MDTPDLPPHFKKLMVEPIDQKARADILQFVEQQIVEAEEELRRFKALREMLKQPEQRGSDQTPGPLEVIDENASKCCRKIFDGAALRGGENWSSAAGIVTCGTCGTEFRREMVGPVAHWRIVEHFAVVRPR